MTVPNKPFLSNDPLKMGDQTIDVPESDDKTIDVSKLGNQMTEVSEIGGESFDVSQMGVRLLSPDERAPFDLLLLADPSVELVNAYLRRGSCFVAEFEGTIFGTYVLLETRPATVELVNVAVREDAQGHGIGRRLVLHAVERAKEGGFQTIELGTGNSSVHQLRLYQKCGFRITGVDVDFFIRHYAEPIYEDGIQCRDMIRLQLDLSNKP